MIFQPRGFKRTPMSAGMIESIRHAVEVIAVRHNCSKSFVIATLLSDALGIKEQVKYYDYAKVTKGRTNQKRRNSKIARFEPRKKRTA